MSENMPHLYSVRIYPVSIGKRRVKTRRLPPSLNARMCWQERAAWNKAWKESVAYELLENRVPKMERAKIELINFAIQATDIDNLASAAKPIIDALVLQKVIPDDSPDFLNLLPPRNVRVRTRKEQRVILEITPV